MRKSDRSMRCDHFQKFSKCENGFALPALPPTAFWHQAHSDKCFFQLLLPGLTPVSLLESWSGVWNCHATCGQQKTIICTSLVYPSARRYFVIWKFEQRRISTVACAVLRPSRRSTRTKDHDFRHVSREAALRMIRHDPFDPCLLESWQKRQFRHSVVRLSGLHVIDRGQGSTANEYIDDSPAHRHTVHRCMSWGTAVKRTISMLLECWSSTQSVGKTATAAVRKLSSSLFGYLDALSHAGRHYRIRQTVKQANFVLHETLHKIQIINWVNLIIILI
jgi:hypothetical protein